MLPATSADADRDRVALQEERLVFARFSADAAWTLGTTLRSLAEAKGVGVAILIRIARRDVFFHAMPGSTPANADWVRRKCNTVELLARSSYGAAIAPLRDGQTIAERMALDLRDYAFVGGGFPITLAGSGPVGSVAVSALPHREDHALVVEALAELAGVPLAEVALD